MTVEELIAACVERAWSYRLWSEPRAWDTVHYASVKEGNPPFAWKESGAWQTPAGALDEAMMLLARHQREREEAS